ncbi:hypothetical protein L211DRAFT_164418 [Terfezia boudieri ATCC MYA-4762]|uniref:Ras-GAP domain-containing protein n=1 Tax=Terfezia boudieri ATCC MYA-4762 TaxID=1051890 RepID=A0A3N4LNF8_9PEZI|nr:hypothetical protein L211DRAFT_164418 [Terfezia boudieri ATCC MYA-4762]
MTGRPTAGSNRLVVGSSDNERYFPLRTTTINPGISRGIGGSHHMPPGLNAYRDTMTIRAVTPEDEDLDDGEDTDDSLAPQHSPTTPPRTPSRTGNRLAAFEYPSNIGRNSPESQEPSSPIGRRGQHLQRFPPLSDLNLRKGAIMPIERPFASGGCLAANDRAAEKKTNSPSSTVHSRRYPSSTGFPSTTSLSPVSSKCAPSISSSTSKGKQRFLRPQSSINTLHKHASSDPPTSPVQQSADTSRVLPLMKKLRGRMEGYLEFRIGDSVMWTKGYCLINEDTGSLVHQKEEGISSSLVVVIPDLRGCRVTPALMEDSEGIIEIMTHSSKIDIKLRPVCPQQYDQWLAALLCWQPIRPAGAQNKLVKPHLPLLTNEKKKGMERRRNSDASSLKDPAIIKVGKLLLWRKGGVLSSIQSSSTASGRSHHRGQHKGSVAWERISCTLQENGEFRLYTEADTTLLTVIQLSQLNRSAVQVLDPSILDQDYCIAIYPQYTPSTSAYSLARPVYLAAEYRMIFEVWFVLLRAFTMPELYGPPVTSIVSGTSSAIRIPENGVMEVYSDNTNTLSDSYRIQRSLFLRVIEAKITGLGKGGTGKENPGGNDHELSSSIGSHHSHLSDYKEKKMDVYAEVVLDGEVRAKTMVRTKTANPFWREDYEFSDLPAVLSDVAVVLKQRDPRWKKNGAGTAGGPGTVTGSGGFGGGLGGTSLPGGKDTVLGRVDIQLDELKVDNETEGWWPLINVSKGTEDKIGEMLLKIELEELIVLMSSEYKGISELLYRFSNGLTHELALIMTSDLRRLASTLLKIFQVAGKATEWLMSLAEEEIDGPYRDSPVHKLMIESTNPECNDLSEGDNARAVKATLMDANILFRGNSLLTKALDAHMRRLGREYLDETLGPHLKKIADEDTYCEVDPLRVERLEDIPKNWKSLLAITRAIWQAIYASAQRCPMELRRILKHIRMCVEERYGDLLKTVCYSSVSGFLFLRFFCPAVLNPKLFGLLKDHPGVRAQRTLTLVAKSLQGLANMTPFGVKEPWMEPMNEFLDEHTNEFRDFIDSVVDVPARYTPPAVPPAYATPTTILTRLSQSSREGFPSLPYLIDQPRAFASLVMMWDKWYPIYRRKYPDTRLDGDLARFHSTCLNIRDRMKECVEKAENAERPSSSLSMRWEEVAERVAANSPVWTSQMEFHPPMWPAPHHNTDRNGGGKGFSSMKGQKILGIGNAGHTTVDDTVLGGGGWEGPHLLGKKTLSEIVGGFRKKVQGKGEKEKERDKDKDKDKEKEKEKEQRELEREREKEERKEREKLKKEARKESSREAVNEWRFTAVADGHPHGHGHHDFNDVSYYSGKDR